MLEPDTPAEPPAAPGPATAPTPAAGAATPAATAAAPATAAPPAGEPPLPALDRIIAGLSGARLCFGEPFEAAGRTLVPVARVRGAGGVGRRGQGGTPGGGRFDARPVGMLEIGPGGTRFERLPDPDAGARAGAAAAAAVAMLAGAATALGSLRRRRRGPRRPSLPRSTRR
ncbi:MAG TPA: hypothetical protein VLA98_09160 [Solirubrobacteraceae bacterium]|nr:hypothetical protein [Solirubrobacteraceae bacterium]